MQGPCPFSLDERELGRHARDYENFETVQRFEDIWEVARDAHKAAFGEWIGTAREAESRCDNDGLTVEKAERLWPFDSR